MAKTLMRQRQIHLDFHTSPFIPEVGADFDPTEFVRVMKRAHVNSVTVFAKCHHGHLYYNTKHPARHPALKPGLDLLAGQIEALKREGIRAPIYVSVQCDEFAANTHPEWIALQPDNTRVGASPLGTGWQILDMSSLYQDYLAEQLAEILKAFRPVDGIFFDMCWNQPSVNHAAKAGMLKAGFDPELEAHRDAYALQVANQYMRRYYNQVKKSAPKASVFFNSRPMGGLDNDLRFQSHVEIEALPSGGWGYTYFPKNVRYVRPFGKPYMGMTARFHKSWADFGGLKPLAALQYEVAQMLAHGAACSIGDQMHPRGILDPAAYDLIGKVYRHAEACEPWTDGARALTQVAVLSRPDPKQHHTADEAAVGAMRLLSQLHLQFDLIGNGDNLDRYELLVLLEDVPPDAALAKQIRAYLKNGGKLLVAGVAWSSLLPELGIQGGEPSPFSTTYIRFGRAISANVADTPHVMYERGVRIKPRKGATALASVVEPYFERSYRHFCSHNQTPYQTKPSGYAAVVHRGNVITFAHPVFKAYAVHANLPYRQLVENCIRLLMPTWLVEVRGPSTMEVSVMRQGPRTIVHLLSFQAERRTADLDIIEDIIPLYDVPISLRLARKPKHVKLAPSGYDMAFAYEAGRADVMVPVVEGHQMVVFE